MKHKKKTVVELQQALHELNLREKPLSEADLKALSRHEQALKAAKLAKERFDSICQTLSTAAIQKGNPTQQAVKRDEWVPEPISSQQVQVLASLFESFNQAPEKDQQQRQVWVDKLRSHLPTVWDLAQTYCYSALQALGAQQDETAGLSAQQAEGKALVESLLGENYDRAALERQIKRVAYHLQAVKNRGEVAESIELHVTGYADQVAGWVDSKQIEFGTIKKINLVPHKHSTLIDFVHTLVHEVSHIANASVDFSYTHSEKALAAEHQGSVFHQLFNGLVQLATSGQPDILKFNSKNYRIFEIALMDKILSGQCTAQELSSIFEQSNKIMALIRREGQRVGDNNKLIRQEDLHYASLATAYGYLDELNTAVKGSQADDLQGGKKFIVSLQQFIENWRNLESCDQEKIRALRTQLPLITSALVMNNADSVAVGIGVLAGLQGYYATLPPQAESASSQSPIERVEAGLLSLAGLTPGQARMEGDQQLDAAQPSDLIPAAIVIPISSADDELSRQPPSDISSEDSLVKSLKAEIEMLEQMNDRYKKRVEDLEKTQDQQDRDYLERLGELKKINDQQHQDHLKILSELASQYNQFEQSMLSKYNEFRGAIEEKSSIATGSRGLSPGTPDSEANTGRSVTGAAIKNLSQEMVAIDSDPTVGEGRMTPTVSTSSSRAASPIVPQL